MADLAHDLIRTTVRAFYQVEHVLVVDALILHSTLSDKDLATVLSMQSKQLRRYCGRLKEDGLLTVQTRQEKRTDGSAEYMTQPGKERLTNRDWYYIQNHRAIDSIKYRLYKLNKHIESLGAPTTEKKDLTCARCKSSYTYLEAMDGLDETRGVYVCKRCHADLDEVEEEERANENESMKRLNIQVDKLTRLMQQIDATNVPENNWEMALSKAKTVEKSDENPGARMETVDVQRGGNLQSAKGMEIKPEKIAVQVQDDEDVKRENAAKDEAARKEKEARQNALPEWISKSTITGEDTVVGAKEAAERRAREAHGGVVKAEDGGEKKPDVKQDDVMADYWAKLAAEREKEAQQEREEEEDEDEEDDMEFEDTLGNGTPANGVNGTATMSTGMNTPLNVESSNATDDEREAKRVRIQEPSKNGVNGGEKAAEATPAQSDEDEDELDFEDV